MAGVTDESIAAYGQRAAPVTQALGRGRAAMAGRNRQWDSSPDGTAG
jgi:hypothetical protein